MCNSRKVHPFCLYNIYAQTHVPWNACGVERFDIISAFDWCSIVWIAARSWTFACSHTRMLANENWIHNVSIQMNGPKLFVLVNALHRKQSIYWIWIWRCSAADIIDNATIKFQCTICYTSICSIIYCSVHIRECTAPTIRWSSAQQTNTFSNKLFTWFNYFLHDSKCVAHMITFTLYGNACAHSCHMLAKQ